MRKNIKKIIKIPEGVAVSIEGLKVTASGPKGKIEKEFRMKRIIVQKDTDEIILKCDRATKKDKKLLNSIKAHITNMLWGVKRGYEYKLQICSIHFPITLKIDKENNVLIIKNFLGENKDREVKIRPNVDVKIDGEFITITSIDKELAGQQAADIENATKIRARDRRVFQDGIWIIYKEKGRIKE